MQPMADLSAEPSMEEILSSIKRIIAEEGDVPGRRARPVRPAAAPVHAPAPGPVAAPASPPAPAEEILELSDPMPLTPEPSPPPAPVPAPVPAPTASPATPGQSEVARRLQAMASPQPSFAEPEPDARPAAPRPRSAAGGDDAQDDPPIVSRRVADASRGALDQLSRLVVREGQGDGTLEGMVREMLRPMLRDWLDNNLPDMVEAMVAREIARITQARG